MQISLLRPCVPANEAGFVRDTFHQAAVADDDPCVVVDHLVAGTVERARELALGQRHTDRIGEALSQRTGRRFDTGTFAIFGMPGGLRMQLAEVFDVVDRHRVPGQMQHRVQEHRRMTVRQHETVAIEPRGIVRVVLEHLAPEHFTDVGETHRRTGVTRSLPAELHPSPTPGSRWLVPFGRA